MCWSRLETLLTGTYVALRSARLPYYLYLRRARDLDAAAQTIVGYLQGSLQKGFGADFTSLPFGSTRHQLMAQMHHNVAVFAAFKNHSQIQEMVAALTDEAGKLRTFSKFKQAALPIHERYNLSWLKAEYQTAILQGQAAAKWQQYEANADLLPNLRYAAVQDERTRPQHRAWHGIVKTYQRPLLGHALPAQRLELQMYRLSDR